MKLALLLFALLFLGTTHVGYTQKYKTAEDSTKLNAELLKVNEDIISISAELSRAQKDLPSYKLKASTAEAEAKAATSASSNESSKATSGKINDSRTAKKRAKEAYVKAKVSRTATREVTGLENKITALTHKLNAKNQRLQELQVMKAAIIKKSLPPAPVEKS